MKVILMKDIKGTGKKGDIINTSDGHARNYLFPRKLAVEASDGNLSKLSHEKKTEDKKRQEALEAAQALKAKIEEKTVTFAIKAGEGGKLFGSVTTKEIAQSLKKEHGIPVEKKKIVMDQPLKSIGTTSVKIKIHPKVQAELKVVIKEA